MGIYAALIGFSGFHNDLNAEGNPSTQGGADAARRIFHLVPQAREDIDAEFRAILYPAPW